MGGFPPPIQHTSPETYLCPCDAPSPLQTDSLHLPTPWQQGTCYTCTHIVILVTYDN